MSVEFERTPNWLRHLVPFLLWRRSGTSPVVHLTFDDGPTPGVTEPILDILREHGAQATFFMLGKQVELHRDLAIRVKQEGHSIGNHGYQHLSGWRTGFRKYLQDVHQGQNAIKDSLRITPKFFRPAYGQLGVTQGIYLWWRTKIVMWDIVAMDYKEHLDANGVSEIVLRHLRPGSIVLLHDSELAKPRVLPALATLIPKIQSMGLRLEKL